MYMYYGTDLEIGKGNFAEFVSPLPSRPPYLVPKLRLGTNHTKLRFECRGAARVRRLEAELRAWRPQAELGDEVELSRVWRPWAELGTR